MSYSQAIEYIESLSTLVVQSVQEPGTFAGVGNASTPSLERIVRFFESIGKPQNSFASVHIGGTNGKGSVTALVECVLRHSGLQTGRYTGPHLLRWNERYHVNGTAIGDRELADVAASVKKLSEAFGREHPELGQLTWFEFLTALGFIYFAEREIDCAAVEVGLGGRWDATTSLENPLVSCIVTVGLDHMHILGDTEEKIAAEKAGIIKRGIPVVTAVKGEALEVIRQRASDLNSPLIVCHFGEDKFSYSISVENASSNFDEVSSMVDQYVAPALAEGAGYRGGLYQRQNALVAGVVLAVCQISGRLPGFSLSKSFAAGLRDSFWPGRFQYLPGRKVLIDGAHNEPAASALRVALDQNFPAERLFVFCAYQNKHALDMLHTLLRPGDRVFVSAATGRRAAFPTEVLQDFVSSRGCYARAFPSVADAILAALNERREGETVVCTGSFVAVKETLLALGYPSVEDSRVDSV
jgi:dihydrofolate synthase / folylpolyglutamate synthase